MTSEERTSGHGDAGVGEAGEGSPDTKSSDMSVVTWNDATLGKKRKKWPIVTGVVAVVFIVAGAGFWVWHEQPSFCNAICHSPMDSYVESYYSGDESLLVTAHAQQGLTCLSCHESKIDEQIAEGLTWVSGNFTDPISPGMEYEDGFCLNESCHDMARDGLASATEGLAFNPHLSRHGEVACSNCHSVHAESTVYCAQCHEEAAEVAEAVGWGYIAKVS